MLIDDPGQRIPNLWKQMRGEETNVQRPGHLMAAVNSPIDGTSMHI